MNYKNPVLLLFTQIIRPGTPVAVQIIYGLTIVGIEFTWLAFVATVVCVAAIKRRFLSISHWLERIIGAVLIFLLPSRCKITDVISSPLHPSAPLLPCTPYGNLRAPKGVALRLALAKAHD